MAVGSYTLSVGGYDPKDLQRGPHIPLKVSGDTTKAVEASDLTAGNDAVTLDSEGKVANRGITGSLEILGKVRFLSDETNTENSQEVPTYAMVEFASPGTVLEFNYDTDAPPAKGDRVILSTVASMAGKVRKAIKVAAFDTVYSADTFMFANIIANAVIDIDATNDKVKVLFLNGGPVAPV